MSKSKSKTTSTQSSTQTSTPNTPDFISDPYKQYMSQAQALLGNDPTQFVAPATANQQAAFDAASGLGGNSKGLYDQAQAALQAAQGAGPSSVTAASLLENLPAYMNPYINDVVNTTLTGYDKSAAQAAAQMQGQAAAAGAFGGSRYGVAQGQFAADTVDKRAATEAGLRSDAFNTGAGLSNSDAGRRQSAAEQNAQLQEAANARQLQAAGLFGQMANDVGVTDRQNIQAQLAAGAQEQDIDQKKREAAINYLGTIGGLFGQVPLGAFVGQTATGNSTGTSTTTQSPSLMSSIGQALNIGTGLFSLGSGLSKIG